MYTDSSNTCIIPTSYFYSRTKYFLLFNFRDDINSMPLILKMCFKYIIKDARNATVFKENELQSLSLEQTSFGLENFMIKN